MPEETINHASENDESWEGQSRKGIKIVWISIFLAAIISILDLIGWITGNTLLKSWDPYWTPMKIITALCFIFTSLALIVIFTKKPKAINKIFPFIMGLFIFFIGLLTAFGWLFEGATGHETSIATFPVFRLFLSLENRMALLSGFIFSMTGIIVILLIPDRQVYSNIAHILCFPVAISGYMVPVSYILGVYSIHQFLGTPVALNSGIAFCAICTAIYFIRPKTWLMRVLTSRNSGGIMARKLLPWLLLLPVVIGWLRINGERTE